MSYDGWRTFGSGELGPWDAAQFRQDLADIGEALRTDLRNNAIKSSGELESFGKDIEARLAEINNNDRPYIYTRIENKVDRGANTMYAVMLLCLLSTILTIALYVCYKKQVKTVNMRDFAIAVMALNTLCCALSIVLLCCRGLGNDPESYRAFIIVISLLLEIGDIVGSIYIYLQL